MGDEADHLMEQAIDGEFDFGFLDDREQPEPPPRPRGKMTLDVELDFPPSDPLDDRLRELEARISMLENRMDDLIERLRGT